MDIKLIIWGPHKIIWGPHLGSRPQLWEPLLYNIQLFIWWVKMWDLLVLNAGSLCDTEKVNRWILRTWFPPWSMEEEVCIFKMSPSQCLKQRLVYNKKSQIWNQAAFYTGWISIPCFLAQNISSGPFYENVPFCVSQNKDIFCKLEQKDTKWQNGRVFIRCFFLITFLKSMASNLAIHDLSLRMIFELCWKYRSNEWVCPCPKITSLWPHSDFITMTS